MDDEEEWRQLRFLILFAGRGVSESRLAARIRARGHLAVEIDSEIGGSAHDVRDDAVLDDLLRSIQSHEFDGVFASPPCKSYMVLDQ